MFGAYAAAAAIIAASVLIGLALWRISGWERASACAPAAGYAVLLIACAIAARLPGRTTTSAVVLAVLVLAAAAVLWMAPYPPGPGLIDGLGLAVVGLALTVLPFLVSGRYGVLGVGDNNDMGVHLGAAYWLQTHAIQQDVMLVKPGYPLGPHSLAATLGTAFGISLEKSFGAVMIVVPALTSLVAYGGLERLSRGPRLIGALLTGFAYMAASYLAQAAFKETIEGLLLLGFVLGLRDFGDELRWPRARQAVPVGVIAAAGVYVYSYPGLYWLVAALGASWLAFALRGGAGFFARGAYLLRDSVWPLAAGAAALVVLVLPDIKHVVDFASSHYANEPKFGLGNLAHRISPAQTLGIWLQPDFRFDPHPYWLTLVGLVLAGGGLLWGLLKWWREEDVTVPATIVASFVIWVVATRAKNPYNAAKALAIASPVVMLAIMSTLLARRRELRFARPGLERLRPFVAAAVVVLAAASSFVALRDAPIGPPAHEKELGSLQPIIAGQPTLYLADDDFGLWELRGAIVIRPRPLYSPIPVPVLAAKAWQPGEPLDFDAVDRATLDRSRYVIESRTPFTSQPPANFRLVTSTTSFELWRRSGPTPPRRILPEDGQPAARLDCTTPLGRSLKRARGGLAHVLPFPVFGRFDHWRPTLKGAGQSASQRLPLPAGAWDISIQYVTRENLTLTSPAGLGTTLPANLERMGAYYLAGTVRSDGRTPVTITASTARLPLAGRLLGASGNTFPLNSPDLLPLGNIVATRHDARETAVPLPRACGRYVDWYSVSAARRP